MKIKIFVIILMDSLFLSSCLIGRHVDNSRTSNRGGQSKPYKKDTIELAQVTHHVNALAKYFRSC